MKKKEFTKKLVLSRRIIASLSNNKLSKIIGGSNGCVTCDLMDDGQDEPLDNGSLLKINACYPATEICTDNDFN